ncbi:MAG: LptF/LptG family permease [Bacteroidaceae bacterium]|nr:LptF/LptG family permease [Bacteroidaceae bacterium]
MRFIKKLDIYIIKEFLLLFAGTFFICLFIFVMQFLWMWMNNLIGKGLTIDLLAKFFWYSSLTVIPRSVPLAVLLASLISFGNLGEHFELLSMKSAGIPLIRILAPLIIVAALISGASFVFQNKVSPYAVRELSRLAWSMKQKSPELEIPEGVFYSEIPGYNLYVEHKDRETGMLYGVMIYTNTGSYNDTQIVLSDSARLQSTADKMHLKLTLWGGERFRNMDANQGTMLRANVPYMRESFVKEEDIIPFDGNFNLMDADLFSHNAQTKNLGEIEHAIDSLDHKADSARHMIYANILQWYMRKALPVGTKDSLAIVQQAQEMPPFDSLYLAMSDDQRIKAWRGARSRAESMQAECEFRALETGDRNLNIRKHRIEWYKKFTMSLACLLFFFIGAPLGAIIRKGGLGVPVVVSVIIFIFYYIVNQAGENNAKVDAWTIESGTWLSSAVLLGIGIFLTHKANSDSVVFNIEGYKNFFMKLLGLRPSRKLDRKEVIINDPDYATLPQRLNEMSEFCIAYRRTKHLRRIPNYFNLFFRPGQDKRIAQLRDQLEDIIEELHNSRDNVLIMYINEYPIINPSAHTRPFNNKRLNMIFGIIFPLGLLVYMRIWRYRLRLRLDLQNIQRINNLIIARLNKTQHYDITS